MENTLDFLSTKLGFNTALSHFKTVSGFISKCKQRYNLADLINQAADTDQIKQYQFSPILNALLIDKFNYYNESFNFTKSIESPSFISDKIKDFDALDFVIAYYHPQLGQIIINPKNKAGWDSISGGFKENELAVLYVGNYGDDFDLNVTQKASKAIIDLLHGKNINLSDISKKLKSSAASKPQIIENRIITQQKPFTPTVPKPTAPTQHQDSQQSNTSSVKKKLSPQYGIFVSNELFHNGNVEAWKKIIESYHTKYTDMKVLIFYDNEQIHDINTLFKWGKVKHGTMIYFRLLGPEYRDISKLRRYLTQGASIRFEAFLKGAVGQILPLF